MKRSFAALTPSNFRPFEQNFIRPHLEYAIAASHPIPRQRPIGKRACSSEKKLALRFLKGCRYVPYEAAVQHLRLFSLTHRRICGDLISMFKITHGLLEFPIESIFTYPVRKGLQDHACKFRQQGCCTRRRQFSFTILAVSFWNKMPAEIVTHRL